MSYSFGHVHNCKEGGSGWRQKDRPSHTHGGDIYSLLMEGFKYEDIIDFSASVNPLGPPPSVLEALRCAVKDIKHYPDPHARLLRKAIAEEHNIEPDTIIPGNGSTELIYLIVRALRPETVFIPVPTFSEYERASSVFGAEVITYDLKEENNFDLDPDDLISSLITHNPSRPIDMLFLCNPNNPTGRLIKKEEILKIAELCHDLKIYLVLDEAFIDFIPGESVIEKVRENPYLIVLRSMTKFYGIAGLRLGYGVFHPVIIEKIRAIKEPWTVNSIAQIAGITSLRDKEFKAQTLLRMRQWKEHMEGLFKRAQIYFIPSSANFYLFRFAGKGSSAGDSLYEAMRKKGILIRDCSDFRGLKKGWFRIAVRSEEENERLFREIRDVL